MKIEILGSRGKIEPAAPNYKNHTGILIDNSLLIDIGEAQYMQRNPQAIVFTHFHPDHAYFIAKEEVFHPNIPHFGPEPKELVPDLQIITDEFEILGFTLTPIPVIHSLRLKSLGYLIEKENKKIFITGDVAWIEKASLQRIPKVDLVITEATFVNKGGRINRKGDRIYGHTGIPDLLRVLSSLSKKIVFTHYGNWFFEDVNEAPDKIKNLAPEGVEAIPAHDGFIIEV